ncbi:HAD [Pyrrhoderma noxium]|uniref:HAD n=1 Tax=Pyrrhoderma noxium TaxID=2282107 RepID=A0A286UB08_9AGAM|nr:HAD [Pyrrhoderma noxium]
MTSNSQKRTESFYADAVLFDMDGTLTDSIAAVEAAWGKVAKDLGLDPEYVIAATHGKRAIDNLAYFRPEIKPHEMDEEVSRFEQTILDFADAFNKSRGNSRTISRADSFSSSSTGSSDALSELSTPALSNSSSRATSFSASGRPSFSFGHVASFSDTARRPSFATRLNNMLAMSTLHEGTDVAVFEDDATAMTMSNSKDNKELVYDIEAAWEIESDGVDRSIRILPGVKNMIESIPAGRYAVATSGAKTYAYGAMTRVGITPPPVTITADDKRLKAGKPAPDPFLLAAKCLGFDASRCVVFEDSPSGIRAGVASGATVIAVCTSHERSKIENCGAHFIVEDMRNVKVGMEDMYYYPLRIRFIDPH